MLYPLRHAALSMNIRYMQQGKNNQNTLAFCSDALSSGKRTVSYRQGELMWSDSNWQTLYFSNPQVQAMFKEGIAHYGLLGGSSAHIVVHPLSISCSSRLGSGEDHNSSQQAKNVLGKRNSTLWGVYTVDKKEIKNNNQKGIKDSKNIVHRWNLCLLIVGKNLCKKRDLGNFILINYSAHINNSPSPSSIRGSCFKSDERLVFPEFPHGSNSFGFKC